MFFAAHYLTSLYQTLGLLVFAYMVRFLPEALGAARTALLQVNPNTEEAARSLGAGPARVFARVTAPQILPGISAGALLVFLTAMKELPITLLLSPIGFDTLATQIWSTTSEAFFTRAALPRWCSSPSPASPCCSCCDGSDCSRDAIPSLACAA